MLIAASGEFLRRKRRALRPAQPAQERIEARFIDEMNANRVLSAISHNKVVCYAHKNALAVSSGIWKGCIWMRREISLCVMLLSMTACWQADDTPPTPAPTATPTPTAPVTGDVPGGGARQVSEETDTFLFEYSYPKAAGDVPELAVWLDQRLARTRASLAADSARGLAEAQGDGFPYNKYSSTAEWEVVADLPGWLSLSAELSEYSGGAHPNYGYDTMVWDKTRKLPLEPIALFTSAAALDAALGEQLCEALNAERAKRRGEPVAEGSDELFDACVTVDETNLLLGSRRGRHFDRIGIQIAPYLAGPYAEGSYELTFPITPELLATVKPEYREAFSDRN